MIQLPPEVIATKPTTKSRAKAKSKSIAESVVEPILEPVVEPVNMKTRKPSNKQPKPVTDTAAEPNIEDPIVKRMAAMRDAKGLNTDEKTSSYCPSY